MCHDLHDKNSWKLVQQWHSCREVIPVYLHRSLNFNRYFNTYKNLLGVVQMLHSLHKTTTTTTIKKGQKRNSFDSNYFFTSPLFFGNIIILLQHKLCPKYNFSLRKHYPKGNKTNDWALSKQFIHMTDRLAVTWAD